MVFDVFDFLANIYMFLTAEFLCIHAVRERLKIPIARAYTIASAISILYCFTLSWIPEAVWFNIFLPFFLGGAFYCYIHAANENWGKLLFIFFIVTSYECFCSAIVLTIAPAAESANAPIHYSAFLYYFLIMSISVGPMYYLLRDKMWKVIRDLAAAEWRALWVIPFVFTALPLILTGSFEYSTIHSWQYRSAILVLAFGAFSSYYLIVRILLKTVENAKYEENMRMMQRQLVLQREQYDMLSEGIAAARKTRHDMRHLAAVIKHYLELDDKRGMERYLTEMLNAFPLDAEVQLCRNYAVNAVMRHYYSMAKASGIAVKTAPDICEQVGRVLDLDLCIMIGNCFENAIEACMRMNTGERYIDIRTSTQGDYFTIAIDNSFDGIYYMVNGVFLSRKREGEGIGLSSVRAIAEKYDGFASFEANDGIFKVSAVIRITE